MLTLSGLLATNVGWRRCRRSKSEIFSHDNAYFDTRHATQDPCLLARRQLCLCRADLSLRQSTLEASPRDFGRETPCGQSLGYDAGPEFHLRTLESSHQQV